MLLGVGPRTAEILLVAATKMNDAAAVRAAIRAGVDICGENRAQEMLDSPLDAMKEGASIRRSFLQPKLRYLFLKSAGWNKEANKLLSGEGKRYRAAHGGMPEKKASTGASSLTG